jgi:NAD(P)-dependent dehydrogenase (short-subunit alcohol dehydrogenase family)
VKTALAKTVEAFGRLDFAFNNAGIEPRKPAPTAEYEEEEWNRIIDINLRGVFLCMKHEIPLISSREAARSSTCLLGPESSASRAARRTLPRNTA